MTFVPNYNRKPNLVFSRWANPKYTHPLARTKVLPDRVLRLPGILSQKRRGITQLDLAIGNVQIDPTGRLPLNDDRVVSGRLDVGPPKAIGLRSDTKVSHWSLGH